MAVILFVISSIVFIVFSMMTIIIRILKKKVKRLFVFVIILSLVTAITGFCMVSPEKPKYASQNKSYNKNEKAAVSNYDLKKLKIYSIENEESILIQYNNKNILIDVPTDSNKADYVFKTIDNYKIKKIDSIILTSSDDKFSGNAADVITKYNITDVNYTYDNINDKVVQAIKAVNSVKGTQNVPKKINDDDSIGNIDVKLQKEKSFIDLTFKISEDSETNLIVDSFKNYLENSNMHKHTLNIGHDSNGNLSIGMQIQTGN